MSTDWLSHAHLAHLAPVKGVNRDMHFDDHTGTKQRPKRSFSPDLQRLEKVTSSILMFHKAIKGLNAGVFDGVELITQPECHFNAGSW